MPESSLEQAKSERNYPKVLFIGASTFEETVGTHMLLYRMFKTYPADKLMVIGSHRYRNPIFPPSRLPDVTYEIREEADFFHHRLRRALSPRYQILSRGYYPLLFRTQTWIHEREIAPFVQAYQPNIILSLTMNYRWYVAYKVARKLQIPLALILHDQWEPSVGPFMTQMMRPKFEEAYRFAKHRFCISPTMERLYFEQTGIRGDVLYPIGADAPPANRQRREEKKELTVLFFGNLWHVQPIIVDLAHQLAKKGIELIVYSNQDLTYFIENGLQTSNVQARSFIPNEELLAWSKEHADILYLPVYFEKEYEREVQYSFYSKLVDYLSLGLPILIQAPQISSLVEFVEQHDALPFAEIVTSNEPDALEPAITALLDSDYRKTLGENSLRVWRQCFAGDVVRSGFFNKLLSLD